MSAAGRRTQIIGVAQQLFSERPYAEVSTVDIARASGITRANLHYHFGTKRDLYVEVVRTFAQLPPLPPGRHGHGTLAEEVRHTIDRWLDIVIENRATFLMIIKYGSVNNDPEAEAILEEGREAWAVRLIELLELSSGPTPAARALIRSFQSMAEAAVDEWLRRERLTRDEVFTMLTESLITLAGVVAPRVLD
jgi:AcrR family transcriptional regulator